MAELAASQARRDYLYDVEREKQVLAVALLHRELMGELRGKVRPDHFGTSDHQRMWEALCRVYDRHGALSLAHLSREFRDQGLNLDHALEMSAAYAVPAEVDPALEVLDLAATRRRFALAAQQIYRYCHDASYDTPESLAVAAQAEVYNVVMQRERTDVIPLGTGMEQVLEDMRDAKAGRRVPRLEIGFSVIDRRTRGFEPGDLVVLAGRTSMGKSAMAMCWSLNVAKRNRPVLYISPEMALKQLARRALQVEAEVNSAAFGREPSDLQISLVEQAVSKWGEIPFYVCDKRAITIPELEAVARNVKLQHPDLAMLVIDHLGEVRLPPGSQRYQVQALGDAARAIRALGQELDVPVVMLCQLSRGVESRQNKRPVKADLRESGHIEEVADHILLLYRHSEYEQVDRQFSDVAEVILAKNRMGPTGTTLVRFEREFTRFSEVSPSVGAAYVTEILRGQGM